MTQKSVLLKTLKKLGEPGKDLKKTISNRVYNVAKIPDSLKILEFKNFEKKNLKSLVVRKLEKKTEILNRFLC